MSQLLNANCPEANQPENVVVSRSQEPNQPEYADVSDVSQLPNASHSDAQEASQPDYVDMSPPPTTNELEYATVSQPSQTNQPEYADVSQPQEANECTTVARRRLPTPPPEENQSDTLPQSQPSENYATISVTVQSDDTDDHIYEPLPQPQEQTVYEIPLAPPPPPLPPREPPSTQPEPLPPLPPRSRSPTAEPTAAGPTETSPSLPTTHNETTPPPLSPAPPQQPQTEIQSAAQQVLEGDRIQLELQRELQQGQANEPNIGESLPPRYIDLSQVPPYNVLTAQQTQAAAADPHQQVFVILNENTGTTQQIEGAIRAENVQIQYEMGDVHHRHKTTKKLRTVLWLILSILSAVIWALFVLPLSVAASLNVRHQVQQGTAPLVPSCHYSVPLLILVLLIQLVAAIFVVYWFTKCCKCARSRKASRIATAMTIIMAFLYAVVVISFAVSVFVFVNRTSEDSTADGSDSEDECITSSSPPFLFATFYLVALLLFLITAVLLTCCDYHYNRNHRNFFMYLKDMVLVYENEEANEETAL
jgi:preprotein translocase subunit SecG